MPLPASATTFSGRMPDTSTSDLRKLAYPGSRSRPVMVPVRPCCAGRPRSAACRSSASPVSSPTGFAPLRHSLIPLYLGGLWLAVIIAPGMPRLPLA